MFSAIDAVHLFLAVVACGVVVALPGLALARVFGLARPDAPLAAAVVGLAVLPLLDSLATRFLGLDAALGLTLALGGAGAWLALREGMTPIRPSRLVVAALAAWLAIVMVEWIDLDIAGKLYQPFTVIDTVKHAATTQAIVDGGAPPRDPFFLRPERASYYYFFYTLAALAQRTGGGLIDARAAVGGLVFWTGLGVYGLVRMLLARAGGIAPTRRVSVLTIAILAAGGLDILGTVRLGLLQGTWIADPVTWNEQVAGWLESLLWVPHHVTGLIAATLGLMALARDPHPRSGSYGIHTSRTARMLGISVDEPAGFPSPLWGRARDGGSCRSPVIAIWSSSTRRREPPPLAPPHKGEGKRPARPRPPAQSVNPIGSGGGGPPKAVEGAAATPSPVLRTVPLPRASHGGGSAILAALCFASTLGLSVWVALGLVGTVALWGLVLLAERRWRLVGHVALAGGLALVLALPQLHDLLAGRAGGGPSPIALTVRAFTPVDGLLAPGPWRMLARLVALPLNYFAGFGVLASGAILYWLGRGRERLSETARVLACAAIAGLVLGAFLKSTLFNNDLGWRVALFPLLAGTVWTIAALERHLATAGRPPAFLVSLLVLGWATSLYGLVGLRAYPWFSNETQYRFMTADPATERALRVAYAWADANLPPRAVLQHDPGRPRAFAFALYGRHPTAVADDFGSLFGAAPAAVEARILALAPLFHAALPPARVEAVARANHVDDLVVTAADPVWAKPDSFVWRARPAYASARVRIIPVAALAGLADAPAPVAVAKKLGS